MDAVYEQFDLLCTEPDGCDVFVQVLRVIVWSYFGIALLIFFVAIRPWTRDLHPAIGTAVSAAGSLVIVLVGRSMVADSGSLRLLVFLTGVGLLAAWIGRPEFTRRRRADDPAHTEGVSEDASPTSSTH